MIITAELVNEAESMLDAARQQQAVDRERVRAFARNVLKAGELSSMALEVLEGPAAGPGPDFTSRRVVELAIRIRQEYGLDSG